MKPSAEVIKLAIRIADSAARSDVECQCVPVGPQRPWKWDLNSIDAGSREGVMESVKYLEARGLIRRDPKQPHIVSFPEASA